MTRPFRRRNARGVALILALVVVAIAASVAARMEWQRAVAYAATRHLLTSQQAVLYALSGETFVGKLLETMPSQGPVDLRQPWAEGLPPLPLPHGHIAARVIDLEGRFNLNNLVTPQGAIDPTQIAVFMRLLAELGLPTDLATNVADWMIPPGPSGDAQSAIYESREPPYRPAQEPMTSVSELLLVAGFTRADYLRLRPYVTALPNGVPLNVNTAPGPVLDALAANIPAENLRNTELAQAQGGFTTTSAFTNTLGVEPTIPLGVTSNYFRVDLRVHFAGARVRLRCVLYHSPEGWARTLARRFVND
jgi:general secretion pathway protein K